MKKLLLAIALLAIAPLSLLAQVDTLQPAATFEAFRPVNDSRVWNFEIDKQNIGTLTSTITEEKSIDGLDGYVIEQKLSLDFRKAGTELTMQSEGEQYLSTTGAYLGCELSIEISGQRSKIKIRRDGDRLKAEVTAENGSSESAELFPRDGFGFELFYVDLMEAYFALQGAAVGQTFADTLYAVQSMIPVNLSALCLDYRYLGLFTGKYDSVFIINVTLPESYRLHMNRSHHLLKVDMPDRKLKIYQDYAGPARQSARDQEPGFSFAGLIRALPVIPIYLAFAAIAVSLLAWRGWRNRNAYAAFIGGAVLYLILPGTLHPLQKLIVDSLVIPAAKRGESLWILAILPTLVGGLLTTLLIYGALYSWQRFRAAQAGDLSAIGCFLGAGLALADSVYLATTIPSGLLISMMLLERAAFVILLAVVGAVLGRAMERDLHALIKNLVAVLILVSGFKYLPMLVQGRIVELQLMYILALLLAVILLGVVMILLSRSKARLARERRGTH
ncbi:MAG: hypothetical protein IPH75_04495 [bacterium]|nr:hypothetical protein [bacterium]